MDITNRLRYGSLSPFSLVSGSSYNYMPYTSSLTIEHLVSVIVRTKDRPKMLQESIHSVIQQQHRPIEIVLINDGGEEVAEIADSLIKTTKDVSLQYISNKIAMGRSGAANLGLNAANGKFSLFLDDDDLLEPAHLSSLLKAHQDTFRSDQLGATHNVTKAMMLDEQNSWKLLSRQGSPATTEQLLYQNCLPIMTVLFNTRLRDYAQFDSQFDLFEDWDFWLQIQQHCTFHFINESHSIYRMHDNASSVRAEQAAKKAYEQIYKKWLPTQSSETLSGILQHSHSLHAKTISDLQTFNQAELNRIGQLHEHALSVIQHKDAELKQLEADYQHAIHVVAQKDADIEKLTALHQQALDVIAKKDEDVAHLSTLHSNALNIIAEKDCDTEQLASLYNEAVEYISKLEQTLTEEREVLNQVRFEFSSLNTRTQELECIKTQLEADNRHKQELLLKPWYWHLYQSMKRKKY